MNDASTPAVARASPGPDTLQSLRCGSEVGRGDAALGHSLSPWIGAARNRVPVLVVSDKLRPVGEHGRAPPVPLPCSPLPNVTVRPAVEDEAPCPVPQIRLPAARVHVAVSVDTSEERERQLKAQKSPTSKYPTSQRSETRTSLCRGGGPSRTRPHRCRLEAFEPVLHCNQKGTLRERERERERERDQ